MMAEAFKDDRDFNRFAGKVENAFLTYTSRDQYFDEAINNVNERLEKRKVKAQANQEYIKKKRKKKFFLKKKKKSS